MKKLFIWGLMLLALVIGISAEAGDALTATSPSLTIATGVSGSGSITLTNSGTTSLSTVSLSSSALTNGSNSISAVTFGTITTPMAALATQSVTVTVAVPSGQALGTYTGTLTATFSSGSTSVTSTSTLTVIVVAQAPDFNVPADVTFDKEFSNVTITKTFTVSNNGNVPLSGIVITSNADAKYGVAFTNVPTSLAVGATQTVTVTAKTPLTEQAGIITLGTVNVSSTQRSETFPLKANVKGRLAIDDMNVKVGSQTDSSIVNGQRIGEDAKPESPIEFDIKIENRYTREDNLDVNDVIVKVTIEDIDDGSDLEEESDTFDLNPKERDNVKLTFKLPLEVQEGDYNVLVELEGTDDDDNTLTETWTLSLRVSKDTHSVKIRKASLSPSEIIQGQSTVLTTEILNLGSRSEDQIVLEIKNANLGLNIAEKDVELDNDLSEDDSRYKKSISINTPSTLPAGTYPIEVRAYYDDDNLDDITTVNLVVREKSAAPAVPAVVPPADKKDTNDDEEKFDVIAPSDKTAGTTDVDKTTVPATVTTVTETKESFFDSPVALYLVGLGAVIVVLLGGVAILLFKLLIGGGMAK